MTQSSYPTAKKDPYASCGNCFHMYYSFEYKTRYCDMSPFGDSLQTHGWCPDWKADEIQSSPTTTKLEVK